MSDLRRTDLTDTGPATGHGPAYAPEAEDFDREINVRGIVWTGVALVVLALVVHLLIWWMLKGINYFDARHDAPLTPAQMAHPQGPPPAPRLQDNVVKDMNEMLETERRAENHAAWVDSQKGVMRLPIADAMEIVARRGVAPLPGASAAPAPGVAEAPAGTRVPGANPVASPGRPGVPAALQQNALPKAPAQPAPASTPPAGGQGGGQEGTQQR